MTDQLKGKLSSATNPLYSDEKPLIKLLLGKALLKVDRLREADETLSSAFNSLTDNLTKAVIANLRGLIYKKDPTTAETALSFFETAISLDATQEDYVYNLIETKQSLDQIRLAEYAAAQRNEEIQRARESAATLKRHAESTAVEDRKKPFKQHVADEDIEEVTITEDIGEMRRSGCRAIHLAAMRERVQDIANLIRLDKSCVMQVDNCKNTGMH